MKELQQILETARTLNTAKSSYAVATVVKIGGSTYRRPGARMLITPEGDRWGTISGGCLEGEVAEQARQILKDGKARLLPFDMQDDDIILGFGTGCNGVVHVLIQPVYADQDPSPIDAIQHSLDIRQRGIMATVIDAEKASDLTPGQFALLTEDMGTGPTSLEEPARSTILQFARTLLVEELKKEHTYLWHTQQTTIAGGNVDLLYEIVRPPIDLFIFGEGHDVHAMVHQGRLMGWNVHVIGRKPEDVLSERFPDATSCRFLMHPEEAGNTIQPNARSAALVMNHTYLRDKQMVLSLLSSTIPYVGVLGPRERTAEIVEELESAHTPFTDAQRARLFGPLGLDIGTETPEEIALSAIAEIQAVLHARPGSSLKERQGPIHSARVPVDMVS